MTHTLNSDRLVKYTTRAEPQKSIYVPLKYARKAKKIQSIALESENMNEFYNHVKLKPSLAGVYIPDNVVSFVHTSGRCTEKEFKLYDEIYLTACLHMANEDLSKNNVHHEDFYIDGDKLEKTGWDKLVEIGRIRSNVVSYGEFPVQESGLERLQKIRNVENIKKFLESL